MSDDPESGSKHRETSDFTVKSPSGGFQATYFTVKWLSWYSPVTCFTAESHV